MASDMTEEEVRASIVPRSDQINADDLLTGPITVTVKGVRKGNKEQPINIDLVETEGRAFRPCKTCRRILIAAWSDDAAKWVGKQMTLFCDPSVAYGGVKIGGVRISHLSGIDGPKTFLLTQTRGKKAEVTIKPLVVTLTPEEQAYIVDIKAEIARATSLETLKAIGFVLKEKPKSICDAVRAEYVIRQTELQVST